MKNLREKVFIAFLAVTIFAAIGVIITLFIEEGAFCGFITTLIFGVIGIFFSKINLDDNDPYSPG